VDIGSSADAQLGALAFENATRRNRPNLNVGSLVFGRVSVFDRDMEPEISCTTASGKGGGFGELTDGYMFRCSLGLCRMLLTADCAVLADLGEKIPFEIAVGQNGRVWVNANLASHVILIMNAILLSEGRPRDQIHTLVQKLIAQAS